jgi:hypothetical protein
VTGGGYQSWTFGSALGELRGMFGVHVAKLAAQFQLDVFFGNVWKRIIIGRNERWIGVRFDPTFPQRGITLQGKSYFLDTNV